MTDTDKINIVSSQVVFELSSFRIIVVIIKLLNTFKTRLKSARRRIAGAEANRRRIDARSKSSTLVVNSHVDSRLPHQTSITRRSSNHATDFCLVD